ncbi:response regulator [Singulisphaera sp. PoT]|uniref:response regulator n=1 Tax=Singulisphaera sp. PoT TaxID=3411797 RepID=UPI003BF5D1EB
MTPMSLVNNAVQEWHSHGFSDHGRSRAMNPSKILLVEDNDAASKGLAKILRVLGYDVTTVLDGASALKVLRSTPPPDFLLTDLRLPDFDGREIARFASQLQNPPKVALITGWDIADEPGDIGDWGIDWLFPKPLNIHELVATLREAGATGNGGLENRPENNGPDKGRS